MNTITPRRYPHLSDAAQALGQAAEDVGLSLSQFNSGSSHNPANGFRLFRCIGYADYFRGDHIAHVRTGAQVRAFLEGYSPGSDITDAVRNIEANLPLRGCLSARIAASLERIKAGMAKRRESHHE